MPPEDLVKALAYLPKNPPPALIVGPSTLDDAGVVRLDEKTGLVQTVDFFPPVVDDPRFYGQIAAANALSDVYAMGGKAISALSIVAWPEALDPEILGVILSGGQEKIEEAGAVLAGGHSVSDKEIKYGLAVSGLVPLNRILSNDAADPSQHVVLTKALGMGAITTGLKAKKVDEAVGLSAMEQMATLNRAASEAALQAGVRAATDVTGFGLLGHAYEVACASGIRVVFEADALPAADGAMELIQAGVVSGGTARTLQHLSHDLELGKGLSKEQVALASDAETSGGLLLFVDEADLCSLQAALEQQGVSHWLVGRTESRGDKKPIALV
jgi:selenide,water dikinase